MRTFELVPTNGRKSFYGKAIVKETDNFTILESYGTEVAGYNKEDKVLEVTKNEKYLTSTTLHHIRSFQELLGYKPQSKREILSN